MHSMDRFAGNRRQWVVMFPIWQVGKKRLWSNDHACGKVKNSLGLDIQGYKREWKGNRYGFSFVKA
jgi:hypothetical protein